MIFWLTGLLVILKLFSQFAVHSKVNLRRKFIKTVFIKTWKILLRSYIKINLQHSKKSFLWLHWFHERRREISNCQPKWAKSQLIRKYLLHKVESCQMWARANVHLSASLSNRKLYLSPQPTFPQIMYHQWGGEGC